MMFKDRVEAGRRLADKLAKEGLDKGLVLGVPRGGVVVAREVAVELGLGLEVVVTKKIGFPGNEELAMGAVAETGEAVWDEVMSQRYGVTEAQRQKELRKAQKKVDEYIKMFRKGKELKIDEKMAVVVDDGIATGRTVEAAVKFLGDKVERVVLAAPVCAADTASRLEPMVAELVCLHITDRFMAVGQFYRNFEQVSDEEVKAVLVK